ncbi:MULTISPECIES: YdcF family protein [Aphanothece]|uniref:YdcF family protein n=1 Tax=Aphanothece TaxID=1121 RepID=UPI003984A8B1
MGFLLTKLLPLALYPLGLGLLVLLGGQAGGNRRWARGLGWAGIGLIWLFAMPLTARQLIWGLEEHSASLAPRSLPSADAVVVLGGGLRPPLAPRTAVEVGEGGDRLLTGVRLLRQGKTPILVASGGRVSFTAGDPAPPEAHWARDLALELGVPADRLVLNDRSRTTAEEARDIGALARRRGWQRVFLVTSAFHMPRSLATFRQRSGLEVIPVPADYQLPSRANYGRATLGSTLLDLAPNAEALHLSTVMLKEHLGLLVYRWRGWS